MSATKPLKVAALVKEMRQSTAQVGFAPSSIAEQQLLKMEKAVRTHIRARTRLTMAGLRSRIGMVARLFLTRRRGLWLGCCVVD